MEMIKSCNYLKKNFIPELSSHPDASVLPLSDSLIALELP